MRPELTYWDHITLSLVLIFVVVFIVIKLKNIFNSTSSGCGNCSSSGACSAPLTKKRLAAVQIVSVASIQNKKCLKNEV